jgi:hypothetical protein
VRLLLVALLLALVGCSSSSDTPVAAPPTTAPRSWLGLDPGDARAFHGPGGELVLIPVDETYAVDGTNTSAVTWKFGDDYTTDYYVEDADGTVWWYGRRGAWRAGRHGETPREVPNVDHQVRFGDRVITLADDGGPVQLETPDGVYTP